MTDRDDARPTWLDWLLALARLRPLWPLPALLSLGALLPFWPAAWVAQHTGRAVWSPAELALTCTGAGSILYWLVLLVARAGMLHGGGARMHAMREPSAGELRLAELALRAVCLLLAYAGPALLLFAW